MKRCTKCKKFKPLNDFYKLSKRRAHIGDGHQPRCKECDAIYNKSPKRRESQNESRKHKRQTDPEYVAKEKERLKKYNQTERGKETHKFRNKKYLQTTKGKIAEIKSRKKYQQTAKYKKAIEKYRAKFPEKRKAQGILAYAIQSGKIKRPSVCSLCNIQCIPEGHHPDYSKPLDVIWVCKDCHTGIHWS